MAFCFCAVEILFLKTYIPELDPEVGAVVFPEGALGPEPMAPVPAGIPLVPAGIPSVVLISGMLFTPGDVAPEEEVPVEVAPGLNPGVGDGLAAGAG